MSLHWGADSVTPLDSEIRVRRGVRRRLYEHVAETVRPPAFWGRYLNDDTRKVNGTRVLRNALRRTEVEYVRALGENRPKLLLVYNDRDFMRPGYVSGNTRVDARQDAERNGALAAENAILRADDMQVADNVCIYADLERWSVSREWMTGWMETMYRSRFYGCGGLYWNVGINSVQRNWRNAVLAGFDEKATLSKDYDLQFDRMIERIRRADPATPWETWRPLNRRFEINVWSNRPYLNSRMRERTNAAGEVTERARGLDRWRHSAGAPNRNDIRWVPERFEPNRPPQDFLSNTCLWQFGANMPVGTETRGLIDMNLATDHGLASMWSV